MERSKQDVNSIQSTKIAVGAPLGGIGDAMFWLTLLPICGDWRQPGATGSILARWSLSCCLTWCISACVLVWRTMPTEWGSPRSADQGQHQKVGHAASIVGMTVIGALVATYVRLNTTLEIKAGDAVVKLQTDVIDKLMPAFLPLVYTLTMFWLVRRGWSPLRLIGITVVLGVVGKFCHFL